MAKAVSFRRYDSVEKKEAQKAQQNLAIVKWARKNKITIVKEFEVVSAVGNVFRTREWHEMEVWVKTNVFEIDHIVTASFDILCGKNVEEVMQKAEEFGKLKIQLSIASGK